MGNGAETDIARLSAMVSSDGSKGQKLLRPLLVPQSGFWLPPQEASWSSFLAALYWNGCFMVCSILAFEPNEELLSCPTSSVPSFLTDTPGSHQILQGALDLYFPVYAAQDCKWQPFQNACLLPLERLPPSHFSILNHTLIGPLNLATLLSQSALHSTSDRPGVFSISLYKSCPVGAFWLLGVHYPPSAFIPRPLLRGLLLCLLSPSCIGLMRLDVPMG